MVVRKIALAFITKNGPARVYLVTATAKKSVKSLKPKPRSAAAFWYAKTVVKYNQYPLVILTLNSFLEKESGEAVLSPDIHRDKLREESGKPLLLIT